LGTAYTPGLMVNGRALIRKTRRLPLKGTVSVAVGDTVGPDTVVARTELPGEVSLIRAADRLGITAEELPKMLIKKIGDKVEEGEMLAETGGLLGRFFKSALTCPVSGTIETINERTGNIGVRQAPKPVELTAFISGTVVEVLAEEGAVIEARGAMVQGIFGIGGERWGTLRYLSDGELPDDLANQIVVVPGRADAELFQRCAAAGAVGLVASCVLDQDLRAILGYDIGVAITGEENVPLSLIVTEGFGEVAMAQRTVALLESLSGQPASISGATQIRAGVIRPEIIVPDAALTDADLIDVGQAAQVLEVGARIRLIREPWFGALGNVSGLPQAPVQIPTGAEVRVLEAKLDDGSTVTVPRANVEIVAG